MSSIIQRILKRPRKQPIALRSNITLISYQGFFVKAKKGIWMTGFMLFCSGMSLTTSAQEYPFQDSNLSFEERVDDLISRLTLEEKGCFNAR